MPVNVNGVAANRMELVLMMGMRTVSLDTPAANSSKVETRV